MPRPPIFPEYSTRERLADGCVHVLGIAASLGAVTALMIVAIPNLHTLSIISLLIYGAGLTAVFGFSAAYHLVPRSGWKEAMRRLDHTAIFMMIAGTYTPFALIKIGGAWGFGLLAAVWTVALIGAAIKLVLPGRFERASIVLYLAQGWLVLIAIDPLVSAVSVSTLLLLGIGGGLYTVGIVFHLWRELPYNNAIWHCFVLFAAGCHFAAIFDTVALAGG